MSMAKADFSNLSPREARALIEQGKAYLAQESLTEYLQRMQPILAPNAPKDAEVPRHVKYWASILESMEKYGPIRKVAISAAPGHSKSTIAQAFTSWFIGRKDSRRVIFVSAEEKLAL